MPTKILSEQEELTACREHQKARSILIGLRAASLEATDDEVQRLAGYLCNKQVELTANIS